MPSTKETMHHKKTVMKYMSEITSLLQVRAVMHDDSKLGDHEKPYFDKIAGTAKDIVYGSPEYTELVKTLKPALAHHYTNNSHHPQHFENGINGMSLLDIVEMFVDWKASSERGKDGDLLKSIDINADRRSMSKQLRQIFINTVEELGF